MSQRHTRFLGCLEILSDLIIMYSIFFFMFAHLAFQRYLTALVDTWITLWLRQVSGFTDMNIGFNYKKNIQYISCLIVPIICIVYINIIFNKQYWNNNPKLDRQNPVLLLLRLRCAEGPPRFWKGVDWRAFLSSLFDFIKKKCYCVIVRNGLVVAPDQIEVQIYVL